MSNRVALLHDERSFFPPDLKEAVGDAADLLWVLVDWPEDDRLTRRLLNRLGTVIEISAGDLDGAARALAAHRPDGIVTFVDDHLVTAAELAERLGLTYHSPQVARTLFNKTLQREALDAAGVPGPRFWPLRPWLDEGDLEALAEQIVYPAVLKPVSGSGSRGILALREAADLIDAYRPDIEQIVEEHLEDDPDCDPRFASYLSVESVVSCGVTTHVATTGRFALADPFRETGNFIPSAAGPSLLRELFALTDAAIAALGIRSAVIHTEIKLTPTGPQLIEVNGRLGGRPPFVLQQVADVNLFRAACDVALGKPLHLNGTAPCRGIGFWRMLQPPCDADRLTAVCGVDELAREPFVDKVRLNRSPGEVVDWRDGTAGHIVTVRGSVTDLDELADAIDTIDRTISMTYEAAPAVVLA